jgi:penicillin-binding protein A
MSVFLMSDVYLRCADRGPGLVARLALILTSSLASWLVSILGSATAAADPAPAPALSGSRRVRLDTLARAGDRYVAELEGGARAELTLDPLLQDTAEDVFRAFQIPYGAAVVLSIPDGRVLALAGRSTVTPELGPTELALHPRAPAASVFKVVSAAALVGEAGLSGESRVCYHGGVSAVLADNLVDLPRIDRTCASLGYGIGKSQNAILAKLAVRHLTPAALERTARALGFGQTIPFDVPVHPSTLDMPTDPLEFGRAAAGFWHSTLSPLHGALLAATVGNRGRMPAPRLIERAFGSEGQALTLPAASARAVLAPSVAAEVSRMMELTTRMGTAKGAFHDRRGRPLLPVSVAGKTGTLSAETDKGHLGYSWFVGFAPADHPRIAFAVVLGNPAVWRIKAAYVARRLVAAYEADQEGDKETEPRRDRDRGAPTRVLATAP